MILKQKRISSPVTIVLETQKEVSAFRDIMDKENTEDANELRVKLSDAYTFLLIQECSEEGEVNQI